MRCAYYLLQPEGRITYYLAQRDITYYSPKCELLITSQSEIYELVRHPVASPLAGRTRPRAYAGTYHGDYRHCGDHSRYSRGSLMGSEVLCMASLAIRMAGGSVQRSSLRAIISGDSHRAQYHRTLALQTATGYSVRIYQSPARWGIWYA